jgi:hypothetical protein
MVGTRISNLLRKITTLLVISCLAIVILSPSAAAALPGSGTQEDPWRIESLADFDEFAADPNYWSGFTRLETDVNLAGRTYSTAVIAPDTNNANYGQFDGTAFTGVFDGNDHKLIGLTINDGGTGNDFLGLFGHIDAGEVRNLGLECGSVSGDKYVGGLVGWSGYFGSVSNCYSTGDVNGTGWNAGGLVGTNSGTISNCYSTGDINGIGGGLVGANSGTISNCYSTGDVNGIDYAGGLLGYNSGSVSNCYSIGDVNGGNCVGGLVGDNVGIVSNCHSTADVNGISSVGGLVGVNWGGTITNCYSSGSVSGYGSVGGLVGHSFGTITNCYSSSTVSGDYFVGGLVGQNGDHYYDPEENRIEVPGYIYNCYSTGEVTGPSIGGGLVGYHESGEIRDSFWDTETSEQSSSAGGTPKTTAEMMTQSTFTDAGWDFVDIWLINEGATYPVLRQEIRSDLNADDSINMLDFALFASHWLEGY